MPKESYHLVPPSTHQLKASIQITGSKSETNRLLLLRALYPVLSILNESNSDDARAMEVGLNTDSGTVDIHHAGTAMRFLTSYFASQGGKSVVLTGSSRMQERPIKILVDALRSMGADIAYQGAEGYPPLRISGKRLNQNKVILPANVSSQYISSLLLIAPSLPQGLELHLEGKITSVPYIKMTLALLDAIGIKNSFEGSTVKVSPRLEVSPREMVVESDWSSASYFYSLVALASEGSQIRLSAYKENSLQGDSVLATIYSRLGVNTEFKNTEVILTKISKPTEECFSNGLVWDLANAPDIAQTIAVTCYGLGISCSLSGLHTLKIKETDRLEALYTELTKLGAEIKVTDKELELKARTQSINSKVTIATYNDHRMAMAFAPLALYTPIEIQDAMVVTKSYPDFWSDMETLGIGVEK